MNEICSRCGQVCILGYQDKKMKLCAACVSVRIKEREQRREIRAKQKKKEKWEKIMRTHQHKHIWKCAICGKEMKL